MVNFSTVFAPELVNRFFDTVTLQKAFALILLEVPAAALQIIIGFIVMAFYSPILMAFDLVLVAAILFLVYLGRGALTTSLNESNSKYRVAYWLEEIARCLVSFKMDRSAGFINAEIDKRVLSYLDYRRAHFAVLLKQHIANNTIQAIATVGVLSIGGFLVLKSQLSLGQLVASELIVLIILSALDKIVQKLESYYDMLTALEKVSLITDFPSESSSGEWLKAEGSIAVSCEKLTFSYNDGRKVFEAMNLDIAAGSRVSLVGISGSGKTTLGSLIAGFYPPTDGRLLLNGQSITALDPCSLRSKIALVSGFNEIFDATVEENITLGRDIDSQQLDSLIDLLELRRDLQQYPNGLKTVLVSEGRNISLGQRQRILLARSIIDKPALLILDEAFTGMDELTKLKIIDRIFDKSNPWTIINISHDAELVLRTDTIMVLEKGSIVESDKLENLSANPNSSFAKLFPELSEMLRKIGGKA